MSVRRLRSCCTGSCSSDLTHRHNPASLTRIKVDFRVSDGPGVHRLSLAPREVCATSVQASDGLERSLRSGLELLPQSLKLNFRLMPSIFSLGPVKALRTRTTGSCAATRPSCD